MFGTICLAALVVFIMFLIDDASKSKHRGRSGSSRRSEPTPKVNPNFVDHSKDGGTYFTVPVVGIRYRTDAEMDRASRLVDKETIKLIPDPDNEYDCNAIKVVTEDGVHIGFLPAEVAEQVADSWDDYVDCFVYSVTTEPIPRVKILPFFKKKNQYYLHWLITNVYDGPKYIDSVYEGFIDNTIIGYLYEEKYSNYIKSMVEKYPDELYFKYRLLKDYIDHMQWDKAKEIADELLNKYNMRSVTYILKLAVLCNDALENQDPKELKKKIKEWSAEAYQLMSIEEYFDAEDLLFKCYYLGAHTPKVVRSLCKCYKENEEYQYLHIFAYNEQDKTFLSEATRDFLFKNA